MKELLLALMTWASAHTGLAVPKTMPTVVYMEPCDLQTMMGSKTNDCGTSGEGAQAAYASGHIYLREDWSAENLYDVSALLHEVGVLATGKCSHEVNEPPAYDAQIAWLEATGRDAFEVMNINGLSLMFFTTCTGPQRYHGE